MNILTAYRTPLSQPVTRPASAQEAKSAPLAETAAAEPQDGVSLQSSSPRSQRLKTGASVGLGAAAGLAAGILTATASTGAAAAIGAGVLGAVGAAGGAVMGGLSGMGPADSQVSMPVAAAVCGLGAAGLGALAGGFGGAVGGAVVGVVGGLATAFATDVAIDYATSRR